MHPGRVDVIGAGALVLDRIMARFGFAEVLVSEHDILDGIAWSLVDAVAVPPAPAGLATRRPPAPRCRDARRRSRELAAGATSLAELTAAAVGLPGLPAPGRLAGGGRARSRAQVVRGRAVLGPPGRRAGATPAPRVLIVGLAPAAHGGNRTGRIFTGDRSGDLLFASLHRCGLAAQPSQRHAGDGQRLIGARMVAAVRCAPPDNKPTPSSATPARPGWTRSWAGRARACASIVVPRRLRLAGAVAGLAPRGLRRCRGRARRSGTAQRRS